MAAAWLAGPAAVSVTTGHEAQARGVHLPDSRRIPPGGTLKRTRACVMTGITLPSVMTSDV